MIFVTIGNQNFQFQRLLLKIENLIKENQIKDEVIAQVGHTKFVSNHMQVIDFLSKKNFVENIENSKFVISHAGTGSLISSLRLNKKVIAGARLHKNNEHIDNHQKEILDAFVNQGYILGLNDNFSNFKERLEQLDDFSPKGFVSNNYKFNKNLISLIKEMTFVI